MGRPPGEGRAAEGSIPEEILLPAGLGGSSPLPPAQRLSRELPGNSRSRRAAQGRPPIRRSAYRAPFGGREDGAAVGRGTAAARKFSECREPRRSGAGSPLPPVKFPPEGKANSPRPGCMEGRGGRRARARTGSASSDAERASQTPGPLEAWGFSPLSPERGKEP